MIAPPDLAISEVWPILARTATLLSTLFVVLGATAILRPSLALSQHIGLSSKYSIALLWLMLFSWAGPGADAQALLPTVVNSATELHALLATSQTAVDAYLTPGTHLLGTTFVLRDGKRLTLHSDGAVLDAQGQARHFLVQDEGVLELEGVRLLNGRGEGSGGAILARRSGIVRLREVEIENSTAISTGGFDGRGGAIAIAGEELERVLIQLATSETLTHDVWSVAYSPDGSRIVSGSANNTVSVWDASNLAAGPLATGTGHTYWVNSVAYSPNGSRIGAARPTTL